MTRRSSRRSPPARSPSAAWQPPEGRPALLRRLRALEDGTDRPRLDAARRRRRPALGPVTSGDRPAPRPPPTRRTTRAAAARVLDASRRAGVDGLPAPELAARHGSLNRGDPGPPRPRRRSTPARRRGGRWRSRPAGRAAAGRRDAELSRSRKRRSRRSRAACEAAVPRTILLDGVTGGGKTAIYAELAGADAGPRAPRPRARPRDRARAAPRRPAARGPRRPRGRRPFRPRRRRAGRRVAAHPRAATSTWSSGRGWPCSRRSRTSG